MEKRCHKTALRFTATLLVALLLCGCGGGNNDEPNNPEDPEIPEYQPLEGLDQSVLLLKGYDQYVGYTLWPSEKIADRDLTGDGFSYDYWYQHKGEAQSFEELMGLCEVPQEQLAAMSTRNLTQTCFMHPYNIIYNAHDNEYYGIMIAMLANCWQELMKRETGAAQLLDLYCELTYPLSHSGTFTTYLSYLDYKALAANQWIPLSALTLVLMTAVDSNALTPEQLTRLAGEIFNKIDNINSADDGLFSYTGATRYPFLLGAFIAYRYDHSLTPLEVSLIYDLTGFLGLPGYDSRTERHFTSEAVASALNAVTHSLERIENGSLLNS